MSDSYQKAEKCPIAVRRLKEERINYLKTIE